MCINLKSSVLDFIVYICSICLCMLLLGCYQEQIKNLRHGFMVICSPTGTLVIIPHFSDSCIIYSASYIFLGTCMSSLSHRRPAFLESVQPECSQSLRVDQSATHLSLYINCCKIIIAISHLVLIMVLLHK